MRISRLLLLLLVVLCPELGWASFTVSNVYIYNADDSTPDIYNSNVFLNQARCCCNDNMKLQITWDRSAATDSDEVAVLAGKGSTCLNTTTGSIEFLSDCRIIRDAVYVRQIPQGPWYLTPSVQSLTIPTSSSICNGQLGTTWNIFVYGRNSSVDSKWSEIAKKGYVAATQPPDTPKNNGPNDLTAGEASVLVSISIPNGSSSSDGGSSTLPINLKGYQVLCEKVDDQNNFAGYALTSPPEAVFKTPYTQCKQTGSGCGTSTTDAGVTDSRVADSRVADSQVADKSVADLAVKLDLAASDRGSVDRSTVTTDKSKQDLGVAATSGCGVSPPNPACVCSSYVGTSMSVRVKGLQNGQRYKFYLVAVDNYYNPSAVVPLGTSTPVPVEDLWNRYQREGGRAKGGFCFVATAAYGSYDHPQVRILRDFRDEVLMTSNAGRAMVAGYYRYGPVPAAWLERHPSLKPIARAVLWPVVLVAGAVVYTSAPQKLLLLTMLPALGLLLIRQKRVRQRRGQS